MGAHTQTRPEPASASFTRSIGDFWLAQTIGRGASGRVKLGFHRYTGEKVAIKLIPRAQLSASRTMARAVERELAVLQLLHHPHLIELRQVLQDASYVYFVMEYAEGGELFQVLAQHGRLSPSKARSFFAQLASAVAWCHRHHICHRDLKPENILLDKTHHSLKVADFGMAAMQPPATLLRTSCGSPHYASPEVIKGQSYYGPAADVWSCGVILYALLAGRLPFDDDNLARLLQKIKSGRRQRPLPHDVSASARDLLHRMLTVDPAQRITMEQVLVHPWILPAHDLKDNPWHHYEQLRGPMIGPAADMDGPIWETLKVLWRGLGHHDQIRSALTTHSPNAQKLTFRLLQQRASRLEYSSPSCQHGDTEDDGWSSSSSVSRAPGPCPACQRNTSPHSLRPSKTPQSWHWLPICSVSSCVSLATEEEEARSPAKKSTLASAFLSLSQNVYRTSYERCSAVKSLKRLLKKPYRRPLRPPAVTWFVRAWERCVTPPQRRAVASSKKVFVLECTTKPEYEAAEKWHRSSDFHGNLGGYKHSNDWTESLLMQSRQDETVRFLCCLSRVPGVRTDAVLIKDEPA